MTTTDGEPPTFRHPDDVGRIWPHSDAQCRHLLRIAEQHLSRSFAYGLVVDVPVYLYGSEGPTIAFAEPSAATRGHGQCVLSPRPG
jgi:hypothetical protein